MTTVATLALQLEMQAAWVALETEDVDVVVAELEFELVGVEHEIILLRDLDDAAVKTMELERAKRIGSVSRILVGTRTELAHVASNAPHVWGLIGPDYWSLDLGAHELDVEGSLRALREETGRTDDEVIVMATSGTLPADPTWTKWLALLGRGDLLG